MRRTGFWSGYFRKLSEAADIKRTECKTQPNTLKHRNHLWLAVSLHCWARVVLEQGLCFQLWTPPASTSSRTCFALLGGNGVRKPSDPILKGTSGGTLWLPNRWQVHRRVPSPGGITEGTNNQELIHCIENQTA